MVEDARKASFGLIFLLLVGALHRYADFAAHYVPSQPMHSAAPSELGAGLAQAAASPSSPLPGAATSTPEQQWLAAGSARTAALAADISERQSRLAKLRLENENLRRQQDSMLAAISSNSAATAPAPGPIDPARGLQETTPISGGAALQYETFAVPGIAATASTTTLSDYSAPQSSNIRASPSSNIGATTPALAVPLQATSPGAEAAQETSNLRGTGLGAAAARAFSAAMSRATGATTPPDLSTAAAAPSAALATIEPSNVPGQNSMASSSSSGGSGGGLAGMVVAFRSSSTKLALTVDEKGWVQADRDAGSSLSSRSFEVVDAGNGWVALRSVSAGLFLEMVPKTQPLAWVVRTTAGATTVAKLSAKQLWKLEGGRIFNQECGAYVNIISGGGGVAVRGHGNEPRKRYASSSSEPSTVFQWAAVSQADLAADAQRVKVVETAEAHTEEAYLKAIAAFPKSNEKRVVSYGLYGSNPKYTHGAIRNAELVHIYFPGWVARFYCDKTVPQDILDQLKKLKAEIVEVEDIKGGIAGMFWRFLVADDPTVDRYIVRDSDSRLNARERFAVEDWIRSGKGVHSIRDHPNHERPLNGGMWGGVHGAVKDMTKYVKNFSNKGKYGGDLTFLNEKIWPQVKQSNQISHDAYSCTKFPNAHPFPTKRPKNYQHVGQVLFEDEKPRMGDINGFMKGRKVPPTCRGKPDWIYG